MEKSALTHSMTYWCCLFAVETDGAFRLVYGYAVSVQETETGWGVGSVLETAACKLLKFTAFLSEYSLESLRAEIENGTARVKPKGKSEGFVIGCGNLVPRPPVYAAPRTEIALESIQSFSDDLAVVSSLWSLSKEGLFEEIIPSSKYGKLDRDLIAARILSSLRQETGIKFDGIELSRIGNFEIVRHLSGDSRLNDGLCFLLSRQEDPNEGPPSVVVWLESPLADKRDLWVNCRMYNGGNLLAETCILDELHPWKTGTTISFQPLEPFTQYEISVWSSGRKVAYRRLVCIRSIHTNMHVAGPARTHVTPWSMKQKKKDRQRVEAVSFDSVSQMEIGGTADDPWRQAERNSVRLAEEWFPTGTSGRYFQNKDGSNLEALGFLIKILNRPGITGVVIADPYFDSEGVESLLARCGNVSGLRILASRDPVEKGALRDSCEACASMLPPKLRVLNLETEKGGDRQFHDRFVVIEFGNEKREVWSLSNSLSSFAKRYPLLVTQLPQGLGLEVGSYVQALETGSLKDRPELTPVQLWPHVEGTLKKETLVSSRDGFPGADLLLKLLFAKTLSEADRATTIESVKRALSTENVSPELLKALAHWAYRGGPQASEYSFTPEQLARVARVFEECLSEQLRTAAQVRRLEQLDAGDPMPECLEAIWRLMRYSSPMDLRHGLTPELYFFSDALWEGQPSLLVEVVDVTKSVDVLAWIASEAGSRSEEGARMLLGSKHGAVKALGIWILHDLVKDASADLGGWLDVKLGEMLQAAHVSSWECLLCKAFVWAKSAGWKVPIEATSFDLSDHLPNAELSAVEVERLAKIVSTAAPYRAITCIGRIADASGDASQALTLRKWCIDQLLFEFPMKKNHGTAGISFEPNDIETQQSGARSSWIVHEGSVGVWYTNEVLGKLDLWTALEPLLRIKDYSRWNGAIERFMLALKFGVTIEGAAPNAEQAAQFRATAAPEMAKVVSKLGPEIWHHFPDFHGRLAAVVAFVASCQDDFPSDQPEITQLVFDQKIPELWRLWMSLHSASLSRRANQDLKVLAKNPSTPVGMRSGESLRSCAAACVAASKKQEERHPELADLLSQVRSNLEAWQSRFTE